MNFFFALFILQPRTLCINLHTVLKAVLAIYPSQLKTMAAYVHVNVQLHVCSMFKSVVFEILDLHHCELKQLFSSKLKYLPVLCLGKYSRISNTPSACKC